MQNIVNTFFCRVLLFGTEYIIHFCVHLTCIFYSYVMTCCIVVVVVCLGQYNNIDECRIIW